MHSAGALAHCAGEPLQLRELVVGLWLGVWSVLASAAAMQDSCACSLATSLLMSHGHKFDVEVLHVRSHVGTTVFAGKKSVPGPQWCAS